MLLWCISSKLPLHSVLVAPTHDDTPQQYCGDCGNSWDDLSNDLQRPKSPALGERCHGTAAHAGLACSRRAEDSSEYVTPAVTVIPLQDPVVTDTDTLFRHSRRTR